MAGNTEQRRRKVLYDAPVSNDEFSGGGHARTASALANTIKEFEDQTRSIGLEGKWGSGKSTIVEIAKAKLSADSTKSYHVFTFDLWTNQSGSFRRSFLESFLTWLDSVDASKTAFSDEMRDKIRDRTVDTRTESLKVFTGFGLFILTFLVLLPWLYLWLSPTALFKDGGTPVLTWIAASIVALVFLVTTYKVVRAYFSRKLSLNGRRTLVSVLSETLAVFSKEANSVHIKQNIREVDPTQNEFEGVLKRILSEYQGDKRKLIVVFDNIDRLQTDKIVEAWSDIRSVLSSRRESDSPREKLTVIVPYDRQHILRSMQSDDSLSTTNKEDIFRKSFDAIFFVAPPVVSDSVKFFNSKLSVALGSSFDEQSAYLVYKIFSLSRLGVVATPRQVIAFINAVSSLWEQWGDKVPLPTIAVFIIHRDEIEKNPETLRTSDSIDARYQDLSGDHELFKNLAALTFNVEPTHAYQVMLYGRLEAAFTSSNPEEIEAIAASPGFEVILPEVYRESAGKWARDSLTQYCNAISNLSKLDVKLQSTLQSKKYALDALPELAAGSSQEWEKAHGLLAIYRICSSEEADRVTRIVSAWVSNGLPANVQERKFIHGRMWMDFIARAIDAHGNSVSHETALRACSSILVPGGVDFLLGAAYEAEKSGSRLTSFDLANTNAEQIADALSELVSDDIEAFAVVWNQVKGLIDKSRVPEYVEKIAAIVREEGHSESPKRLRHLLESFMELFEFTERSDESLRQRRAVVDSGVLYKVIHSFVDSKDDEDVKASAGALFILMDHFRSKAVPTSAIQHAELGSLVEHQEYVSELFSTGGLEKGALEEIVKYTRKFPRLGAWILAASASRSRNGLYLAIIEKMLQEESVVRPQPKVVASCFAFLQESIKEPASLERLMQVVGNSETGNFDDVDPSIVSADLLRAIKSRQESGWIAVVGRVDEWLKEVKADAWPKVLREGGRQLELLEVRSGSIELPPSAFRGPLAEYVVGVLTGEIACDGNLDYLVEALPPNNRDGVASDILERAGRVQVLPHGLELVARCLPALLGRIPFDSDPQSSVTKFILPAIQSGSPVMLEFLKSSRDSLRRSIAVGTASLRGQVQEFIGPPLPEDDESAKARKIELREVLDLPTPPVAVAKKE